MNTNERRSIAAFVLASFFLLGILISSELNSEFGTLEVRTVSIPDGSIQLSGLLYQPNSASSTHPSPAIIIAHGIGGSKEMMSGIGLELAKQGFAVLCLDLLGHGGSGGTVEEGTDEPSFGVLSGLHYLRSRPFVNASAIGLVGHSLGAGAIRAAFAADRGINASVLIAGGFGDMTEGPVYGVLNATFPRNLLVIVGKYDVLFDLDKLETGELPPAFGTQQRVVPGIVYGNFSACTARKLVTPSTTHLFEPLDSTAISETVAWMENSFESHDVLLERFSMNQTYLLREAANIASLASLLGYVLLAFFPLARVVGARSSGEFAGTKRPVLPNWKFSAIWGSLGLVLFLPMSFVGLAVPFPPLIFGASIAWWLLAVGLLGLLLLALIMPRLSKVEVNLKTVLAEPLAGRFLLVAIVLFLLIFAIVNLLEAAFNINLRIISPIFRSVNSTARVLSFFEFLPFFLAYFFVEGLYFHKLRSWDGQGHGFLSDLSSCGRAIFGKVAPFLAVIFVQYAPLVLFGVLVVPSYVGFLVEFLWLIIPIFIITTTCSWWFYRNTRSVWAGAMFNALVVAWIASTVFPF